MMTVNMIPPGQGVIGTGTMNISLQGRNDHEAVREIDGTETKIGTTLVLRGKTEIEATVGIRTGTDTGIDTKMRVVDIMIGTLGAIETEDECRILFLLIPLYLCS